MPEKPISPEFNDEAPLPDIRVTLEGIYEAVSNGDVNGVVEGLDRLRAGAMHEHAQEEATESPDQAKLDQLRRQVEEMSTVIGNHLELIDRGEHQQVFREAMDLYEAYVESINRDITHE